MISDIDTSTDATEVHSTFLKSWTNAGQGIDTPRRRSHPIRDLVTITCHTAHMGRIDITLTAILDGTRDGRGSEIIYSRLRGEAMGATVLPSLLAAMRRIWEDGDRTVTCDGATYDVRCAARVISDPVYLPLSSTTITVDRRDH